MRAAVRAKRDLVASSPGTRPERDARFSRLRRGIYVDAAVADDADRRAAYRLRIRAVHVARTRPIFARESALAEYDIPYGLEPPAVYTTGSRSTAKKKAGVVHAPAILDKTDVVSVGGLQVCSVAYALAEFARRSRAVDAVAAIDNALHRRLVTKEELFEALARQSPRGRAQGAWAIEFADARAESVGESWSRVRVFELGFAAPELQVRVTGPTGNRWRVDMRFNRPGRRPVYGEFDGKQKYGELAAQQGRRGTDALMQEKARDDELLFTGDPAHWVWDDVLHPERLERILTAYGIPRVRGPFAETQPAA
ncbi:hypothetical protein ABA31_10130 [Agrococcus baldri]|uniref:Transcriptional regulator, AbiEi antitoxin, Type IV TA system n=1 Tax=Agrococcus baldri TaxID=153730 RepID=A0AA87RK75_9MICO|nr:hypothetical protein ABA31_10130 [Agrococcus baldri]